MAIASIQAWVWNYTGPYGFGDMDMLGTPLFVDEVDVRNWEWKVNSRRAKNAFQFMGAVEESIVNWNSCTRS